MAMTKNKKKKRPESESGTESESGAESGRARGLIMGGAVVSLAGIVAAAAGNNTLGGGATVAGWLALVYGIHRFGRGG